MQNLFFNSVFFSEIVRLVTVMVNRIYSFDQLQTFFFHIWISFKSTQNKLHVSVQKSILIWYKYKCHGYNLILACQKVSFNFFLQSIGRLCAFFILLSTKKICWTQFDTNFCRTENAQYVSAPVLFLSSMQVEKKWRSVRMCRRGKIRADIVAEC